MAPTRRQSTSKAPPQTNTPSIIPTPITRAAPTQPTSKLKIHPLLEVYEATIASLIGTLSDDPFRSDSITEHTKRLVQCEQELEEALEEGNFPEWRWLMSSKATSREYLENSTITTAECRIIKTLHFKFNGPLRSKDIISIPSRLYTRYNR